MSTATIEGAPCTVCNAGKLFSKVGLGTGSYAGQTYYVCSNWQHHSKHKEKGDPEKSPWILATDTDKIEAYLANAAGLPPPKKAKPAAVFAKPAAKPVTAAINSDHVLVALSAKVDKCYELLVALSKNSTSEEQQDADE